MTIIPAFPQFVSVGVANKETISSLTAKFPLYSDFNFTNLLSWNLNDGVAVAWLHGNLVFRFKDYVSNEIFLTFIGPGNIAQTASELLAYATKSGIALKLKLIPEIVAEQLAAHNEFTITEDKDNADYIISLKDTSVLEGSRHKHTRRSVNKFKVLHELEASYREIDCLDTSTHSPLFEIFLRRELAKDGHHDNELAAMRRLLDFAPELRIKGRGLFVSGKLKAFILFEVEEKRTTVLGHFWKADTHLDGVYHYLLHEVANELYASGFEYMNIEQDLGIPGLRTAKQFLRPVDYLRKYTIGWAPRLTPLDRISPKQLEHIGVGEIGS